VPTLSLLVIRCSDFKASKRFYEALGLVFQLEQHERGPQHCSCLIGDTVLELYPAMTGAPTVLRLGFHVADVRVSVDAALAHGGRLVGSFSETRAVVLDPDGSKIELSRGA
jgi:lactoylglutathione lyase